MKKVVWIITFALFSFSSKAQFSKATLQATGLTCAMCSNAINKALQKVAFVESVKPDIKNSAFSIIFRKDSEVNIDALKDAVEDAGFSVGSLKLTATVSDLKISHDEHVRIGKDNFHFLEVNSQVVNGEITIKVLDRDFVTAKVFKKYSASTKMRCIESGKMDGERVYHVTI